MTKTAVGAEEPDDNEKKSEAGYIYIPDQLTWSSTSGLTTGVFSGTISATNVTYGTIPPKPLLFANWIQKTKYLQEEFYGQAFEDFTHEQLVEWVRINVLAAEDELHEALGEISWKPWASSQYFNREAYLGEIVDVLHFVGNLLAGAGITDSELNNAYLEKMERNRQRQREGYTGTDKCTGCKRAVDDIVAHGGDMVQGDNEGHQWCSFCIGSDNAGDGDK